MYFTMEPSRPEPMMEDPQISQITQVTALWMHGPVARKETETVQTQVLFSQAMPDLSPNLRNLCNLRSLNRFWANGFDHSPLDDFTATNIHDLSLHRIVHPDRMHISGSEVP